MNRVVGFALTGGLLASSAAASAAGLSQVAHKGNTFVAAPAVQQAAASVEQPLPARQATPAPAIVTHRIIQASRAQAHAAIPPASAELAPANQAALSPCPPARTALACRKP